MKTTTKDSELDSELQELYIVSNHWLSDIRFEEDEIKVFKHVINKYLTTKKGMIVSDQVKSFNETIAQQEAVTSSIKNKILELLKYLGPFVTGKGDKIDLDLLEKFGALETEVKALLESVKKLKNSLFSFTETEIRIASEDIKPQL